MENRRRDRPFDSVAPLTDPVAGTGLAPRLIETFVGVIGLDVDLRGNLLAALSVVRPAHQREGDMV
jgi:hypothetical protein